MQGRRTGACHGWAHAMGGRDSIRSSGAPPTAENGWPTASFTFPSPGVEVGRSCLIHWAGEG
eukprot:355077-Chlamydomonas_euryale.AAC.6